MCLSNLLIQSTKVLCKVLNYWKIMLTLSQSQKRTGINSCSSLCHRENGENSALTLLGLNEPTCSQSPHMGGDLFLGTLGAFTRPLRANNGAKQELEQFRVNVNPCSHEQLKIILTSKEVSWVQCQWENFLFFFFICRYSYNFYDFPPLYCTKLNSQIAHCLFRSAFTKDPSSDVKVH